MKATHCICYPYQENQKLPILKCTVLNMNENLMKYTAITCSSLKSNFIHLSHLLIQSCYRINFMISDWILSAINFNRKERIISLNLLSDLFFQNIRKLSLVFHMHCTAQKKQIIKEQTLPRADSMIQLWPSKILTLWSLQFHIALV